MNSDEMKTDIGLLLKGASQLKSMVSDLDSSFESLFKDIEALKKENEARAMAAEEFFRDLELSSNEKYCCYHCNGW